LKQLSKRLLSDLITSAGEMLCLVTADRKFQGGCSEEIGHSNTGFRVSGSAAVHSFSDVFDIAADNFHILNASSNSI